MASIAELRTSSPNEAKLVFERGEKLVQCASLGEFRKFRQLVEEYEGEILAYFTTKMFIASLIGGHLMISCYIIDNGYPHTRRDIPSAIHSSLEVVDDDRGEAIVEFLLSKNVDPNCQLPGTWLTPLHIAIRRLLLKTTIALIQGGADVNAVAKDDLMPLNVAVGLEPTPERDNMICLLREKGARETWRRDISEPIVSVGVKKMESKFVSFSGGGSVTITPLPSVVPSMVPLNSAAGGFVSMKGMMFSTSSSNDQSEITSDSTNLGKNIPQSVVIGEPRMKRPPRTMTAMSSGVLSISGGGSTNKDASSQQEERFTTSSDGGMMFSTG